MAKKIIKEAFEADITIVEHLATNNKIIKFKVFASSFDELVKKLKPETKEAYEESF